ncbi:oxidoreductase, molybdopterin binding protein [Novosphingobium aromaticivorans DSM 12444]|uniref:Oxidoreductase, molybdopterin binding protein n=1 Tax=Novosphingobium aromaticivorans (strain ATCC 700278 / DSM 12444 / CCUG 56034 / CIP 105152 / NBRC 16084 / F199) TaxID=279238 RepID=Q2G7C1_NOVAD|nr:molybdopterin-binding protein [Novosphingobium aromaticivorans]ABD26252.1 oxidoreductase, molybdopterin binding protein [Novosphingobium aromaticivorans DSM 12444]SCY56272.1 Oxidoreductase molybdopterin binding domain-containing protein [Novosphingobium aromaticivorans]
MTLVSRRSALIGTLGLAVAGCDRITTSPTVRKVLTLGEKATLSGQRLVTDRNALAPEFTTADLSPRFRVNGNRMPASADYQAHMASGFSTWQLEVGGLVRQPLRLSLAQLMSAPQRTQITRHDCVEGWSAIGEWTGVPLALLLRKAGISSNAQYVVFHCADDFSGMRYYESIDMIDAMHPQTILAHTMNRQPLSVAHGAPIRLRVERQLGYKQAKYVMKIEAVDRLGGIHGGKGGYWEDHSGYQWYAGI